MNFDDNILYRLLKIVENNSRLNQRVIAQGLGLSLGKTNYCVRALMEKGWLKAKRFQQSNNKAAYAYILTPQGVEEKTRVTVRFLRRKMTEYEALQQEIAALQEELGAQDES